MSPYLCKRRLTCETNKSVDADDASALAAGPPGFLALYMRFDSMFFDVIKVFKHAHIVFGPVSLIQIFESSARILLAFKTKTRFIVLNHRAILDYTTVASFGFVFDVDLVAAPFAMVFLALVTQTKSAVHSARRNQINSHSVHFTPHCFRTTEFPLLINCFHFTELPRECQCKFCSIGSIL